MSNPRCRIRPGSVRPKKPKVIPMDKEARDFHESALMAMAGAVTEADTVDGDYVTGFAVVMFTKQGREIASAGFTEEAGTNSDLFPDEVAAVISENLDDADEQESA